MANTAHIPAGHLHGVTEVLEQHGKADERIPSACKRSLLPFRKTVIKTNLTQNTPNDLLFPENSRGRWLPELCWLEDPEDTVGMLRAGGCWGSQSTRQQLVWWQAPAENPLLLLSKPCFQSQLKT